MDAKECPKCRLINPPSAKRCDCGYDFESRSVEESYLAAASGGRTSTGSRVVGCGCLALAIFLLISGVFTAVGGILKHRDNAQAGDETETMGFTCGALLPGLAALSVAIYLLRRNR